MIDDTRDAFVKTIVGSKLGLIVLFIIFSIVNGHKEYVEKNPRKFMIDSIVIGVSGALAAAFMCFTRGRTDLWVNQAFIAMLFFFFFHVTREFAGYFAITNEKERTENEDKQIKVLKKPVMIITGIVVAIAVFLVIYNHDTPNYSKGIFSSNGTYSAFAIELIITTLIFTIGESIVSFNHNELTPISILQSLLIYGGGHILLQFGGFYAFLYEHKIPNKIN